MHIHDLPLNTWMVVEQQRAWKDVVLVSSHATQDEAEAARDRRNDGLSKPRYSACILLEPIAQHMGGQGSPAARAGSLRIE